MVIMVTDPIMIEEMLAKRQECGGDRFDEVWDGVYVMAAMANNEHQDLAGDLSAIFKLTVGWTLGARVEPGANISDREDDWKDNYRCPDVVVFMPGNQAKDCDTHWFGGPDFAVEILSRGDRSREKFAFYAKVGVRELLLIDRYPWQLELYRLQNKKLRRVGISSMKKGDVLATKVLPLAFRLTADNPRPRIDITHNDGVQHWRI